MLTITAAAIVLLIAGCQRSSFGPGASARLSGRVIAQSDVSGVRSQPITRGQVMLIPETRLVDVARAGGFDPSKQATMRTTSFRVTDAEIDALGASTVGIGADGRFMIDVASGGHLLCLVDVFPDDRGGASHWVRGCIRVKVRAGTNTAIVTFGIGGVGIEQ
jgi:hypothetical protein